eukprot:CAMPEP_0184498952 /NCGR_PEP_ID=MMETSP0113_2-20130426/40265_1 /TAXON_ID=91329 /ORGANISM="Norrisiella sphaerica, Strain BC52" /LENGTH=183 /DNA_ID=CAMNT_0026886679 /DNA_START=170 /DNA_END=721 /DNA_ORIENTATION=-
MRSYYKPGQQPKDDRPPANPFGFQGFKSKGILAEKLTKDNNDSGSSRGTGTAYSPNKAYGSGVNKKKKKEAKILQTDDGRMAGTGETKGSLAHFMNKELGVKTTGKNGLRKTVFNSEEEEDFYRNKHKPTTISQLRSSAAGKQQLKAAHTLGSIFMEGAKDKITGKILLPSTLKKKSNNKGSR